MPWIKSLVGSFSALANNQGSLTKTFINSSKTSRNSILISGRSSQLYLVTYTGKLTERSFQKDVTVWSQGLLSKSFTDSSKTSRNSLLIFGRISYNNVVSIDAKSPTDLSDTLNSWTDEVHTSAELYSQVSDDLNNWLDSVFRTILSYNLAFDDLDNWFDTVTYSIWYYPDLRDSLNNWQDSIDISGTGDPLSDTINQWSDNTQQRLGILLALSDNFTLSDSIKVNSGYSLTLTDVLNNLNDFIQTYLTNYSFSDQMFMSDAIAINRSVLLSFAFNDTFLQGKGKKAEGLRDGLTLFFIGDKIIYATDEMLPLDDNVDLDFSTLGNLPALDDGLTMGDEVQTALLGDNRFAFYDGPFPLQDEIEIGFLDFISTLSNSFTDRLNLTDSGFNPLLLLFNYLLNFDEALSLQDSLNHDSNDGPVIGDSLALSDSIQLSLSSTIEVNCSDDINYWLDQIDYVMGSSDIAYLRRYLNDAEISVDNNPITTSPTNDSISAGDLDYIRRYLNDLN